MAEKTIALTGAEIKVEYGGGANAWLRNDGTSAVYAARTAGIVAGADGVTSIPAGQAAAVYGAGGTVYLLGEGEVMLVGSDYSACPFKTSAQGGGADNVARAAINEHTGNADIHVTAADKAAWDGKAELSDIPDKLDGGNADTLGGKAPSVFVQNIPKWASGSVKDLLLATNTSGCVWIDKACDDLPDGSNNNDWWYGIVVHSVSHYLLVITNISNYKTYVITYNAGATNHWSNWRCLADGGNANSVGAYTEAKIAALEARIASLEAAAGIAAETGVQPESNNNMEVNEYEY